jgi:hypothetical protein
MATITFDTLKFSRKLESAGIPREHAVGIAEAVADVQAENMGEMVTKGDIALLRAEIKELELRMTIKFGIMVVALGGIIGGIILTGIRFMLTKGV